MQCIIANPGATEPVGEGGMGGRDGGVCPHTKILLKFCLIKKNFTKCCFPNNYVIIMPKKQ